MEKESPQDQFERNNLQTEDVWEGPGVAYWILHEDDFDQWWSMWTEEGECRPYYINWKADPGRKRVEMAHWWWKMEQDGSDELAHILQVED